MNWLPDETNGRMATLFLIFLASLLLVMKFTSLRVRKRPDGRATSHWLTPTLAPSSLLRCRPRSELPGRLVRAALGAAALALYYSLYWSVIVPLELPAWTLGYLGVPVLLMYSSLLVVAGSLLWLPGGNLIPALHDNPPLMCGIAEFWGRRWNLWFSDWFRYNLFSPLRNRPTLAVVLVFFVSGVMHEWVVNVPLYLVTGRNLFGTMMLYFLLQAAGLLIERRCFADKPAARVAFAWLVVFGTAPLVLNEGLLRALQLWPE